MMIPKDSEPRSLYKTSVIGRAWFYFRLGYSTYFSFALGYASSIVSVYYLLVKNVPWLLDIFPNFTVFAVAATLVCSPLAILVAWVHMKRSPFYRSDTEVGAEANPFYFKYPPGYTRAALGPFNLMSVRFMLAVDKKLDLFSAEERAVLESTEKKFAKLLDGSEIGRTMDDYPTKEDAQ